MLWSRCLFEQFQIVKHCEACVFQICTDRGIYFWKTRKLEKKEIHPSPEMVDCSSYNDRDWVENKWLLCPPLCHLRLFFHLFLFQLATFRLKEKQIFILNLVEFQSSGFHKAWNCHGTHTRPTREVWLTAPQCNTWPLIPFLGRMFPIFPAFELIPLAAHSPTVFFFWVWLKTLANPRALGDAGCSCTHPRQPRTYLALSAGLDTNLKEKFLCVP